MDTFFGLYFHFCLELALKTWAKASLTQSLWVHEPNHTHSLVSFQWSGLSDQWALHLTECCLQVQKWYVPLQGEGRGSGACLCQQNEKWSSQCRPTFLQPAKAAAMCTAPLTETHPPPSVPPFLLGKTYLQNGLHQLTTYGQSQTMPNGVIGG